VFDTNPGGAGYANQLASIQLMKEVIDASERLLLEAKTKQSKDMLLDKFTLRFAKYIDIEAALKWIQEERESSGILPKEVAAEFPNATEVSIDKLKRAYANSFHDLTIFADDDFKVWDYNGTDNGWRGHLLSHFVAKGSLTTFCLTHSDNATVSEPILQMIREVNAWTKAVKSVANPFAGNMLYPLAYIDDFLYFTNSREHAMLNDKWGAGTMFCVRTSNPAASSSVIDTSYKQNTKLLILSGDSDKLINSQSLGEIIQQKTGGLIEQFVAYAKAQGSDLLISYQDEHLKNVLGMVISMQAIEHFVKQIGKDFSIQYLIEKYEDNANKDNVSSNLPTHIYRDEKLKALTESWLTSLKESNGITGHLVPICSLDRKILTHWRVLTIQCGEKRLSIYPDGGFANGWRIAPQSGSNRKFYTNENTDTNDNIALTRVQDIKFDVAIEKV
jgi:hypothetical protein